MALGSSPVFGLLATILAVSSGWAVGLPGPVFILDQPVLESSPSILQSRRCLPADYVSPQSEEALAVSSALASCSQRVWAGQLGRACDGVPVVALLYVCMANSLDLLDGAGSSFDWSSFESALLAFTPAPPTGWQLGDHEPQVLLEGCLRSSDARLAPRQRAVFSFACWQWSVASQCDAAQKIQHRVDEAGLLRAIRLLAGHCPMSISRRLLGFGLMTGSTWTECSRALYTGHDLERRLEADKARVVCLLQDFIGEHGYLDVPRLRAANDAESTNMLRHNRMARGIRECGMVPEGGSYMDKPLRLRYRVNITAEEFVDCFSTKGTLSCAYQEANRLALEFPEGCSVSA